MELQTKIATLKTELKQKQDVHKELSAQIMRMTLLRSSDRDQFLLMGGESNLDGFISLAENAERDIDQMQKEIVELRQLNLFD